MRRRLPFPRPMKKAPTVNNSTRAFPFPIWLIPGKPSTVSPAQLRQYLDASSGSWASGTTSTTRPGSPGSTLSYEKTTPRGWSFSRWKGPPRISSLFLSQKFSFSPLHGDVPKRAGILPGFRGAFRPKTFREDCFPKVLARFERRGPFRHSQIPLEISGCFFSGFSLSFSPSFFHSFRSGAGQ